MILAVVLALALIPEAFAAGLDPQELIRCVAERDERIVDATRDYTFKQRTVRQQLDRSSAHQVSLGLRIPRGYHDLGACRPNVYPTVQACGSKSAPHQVLCHYGSADVRGAHHQNLVRTAREPSVVMLAEEFGVLRHEARLRSSFESVS
jgi:hypothetical protein